ncbi:MAG TPA: hypothetical protein VN673_05420, partial [Clostridia bacterium]|nr:hypothetical protein [Clostridia bacterium]
AFYLVSKNLHAPIGCEFHKARLGLDEHSKPSKIGVAPGDDKHSPDTSLQLQMQVLLRGFLRKRFGPDPTGSFA